MQLGRRKDRAQGRNATLDGPGLLALGLDRRDPARGRSDHDGSDEHDVAIPPAPSCTGCCPTLPRSTLDRLYYTLIRKGAHVAEYGVLAVLVQAA